ncbi:MAG: PLP-dependent aspartate aminotransferase family protein [Acidobacteriota bacterium]
MHSRTGSGKDYSKEGHLETLLVHGAEPDPGVGGAVVLPIFQSSTFEFRDPNRPEDLRYIRWTNTPNHEVLQRRLALLEKGEEALVTGSGMAAISATLFALLRPGDHLAVQNVLYGGTYELAHHLLPEWGVEVSNFDPLDLESLEETLRPNTRVVLVESISNPHLVIGDLPGIIEVARRHGALAVIDNTFATPVNYRPLEHGFDVVVHSCTKYLNGHSDLVAGAVVGRSELLRGIRKRLLLFGGCLDPHACFLLERGLKTLALRVREQNRNAAAVAHFLAEHPRVRRVYYPGLPGWGSERAKRDFAGFGGMVSFELDGDEAAADQFVKALRIPREAPSLGGIESLVTRPVTTSHRGLTPEELARAGISPGLIRLSVGIEATEDILEDLDQAFRAY